jgi:hypothetical protein
MGTEKVGIPKQLDCSGLFTRTKVVGSAEYQFLCGSFRILRGSTEGFRDLRPGVWFSFNGVGSFQPLVLVVGGGLIFPSPCRQGSIGEGWLCRWGAAGVAVGIGCLDRLVGFPSFFACFAGWSLGLFPPHWHRPRRWHGYFATPVPNVKT